MEHSAQWSVSSASCSPEASLFDFSRETTLFLKASLMRPESPESQDKSTHLKFHGLIHICKVPFDILYTVVPPIHVFAFCDFSYPINPGQEKDDTCDILSEGQ